jgi:hypothetical protein
VVSGFSGAGMPKFLQRFPGPADLWPNSWKFVLLFFCKKIRLQNKKVRLHKRKLVGVKLAREVPENHFLTAVVKTAE